MSMGWFCSLAPLLQNFQDNEQEIENVAHSSHLRSKEQHLWQHISLASALCRRLICIVVKDFQVWPDDYGCCTSRQKSEVAFLGLSWFSIKIVIIHGLYCHAMQIQPDDRHRKMDLSWRGFTQIFTIL